jgi:hypothetical protein
MFASGIEIDNTRGPMQGQPKTGAERTANAGASSQLVEPRGSEMMFYYVYAMHAARHCEKWGLFLGKN